MCGIIGILGNHEVGPLLVNALRRLEYRGYDSAGIATLNNGNLGRRRSLGKLAELSDLLVRDPLLVNNRYFCGHMRVRIIYTWFAVCSPTCMPNTGFSQ